MIVVWLFLGDAWDWIKKYWKYLLFPVGIVLGVIAMLSRSQDITVTPSALHEVEKDKLVAQEEAEERIQEAKKENAHKVAEVEREHARTIRDLTDEQKGQVEKLREDPDELNDFLLGVGKSVRP